MTTASMRKTAAYCAALCLTIGLSAELTARVQDWLRDSTPILSVPNWDRDLFIETAGGRRGRPNGRFKKWSLNEFGFRAGPMTMEPQKGRPRIVVLGASETFGLYESPANEFPAQLAALLASRGQYEVINAALTGLTLHSTIPYWNEWVSRFHPDIVAIYPSPLFYLVDNRGTDRVAVAPLSSVPALASIGGDFEQVADMVIRSSRLVERAKDLLDVPDPIQRIRDARTIEAVTRNKPADWLFQTLPQDRVDQLLADIDTLVTIIAHSGARPIVLTHASRVAEPPRPQDADWLWRARVHMPRASPGVIGRFNTATNEAIRAWAVHRGVTLVDIAADMNGREDLFGDLIHFNDAGAAFVARALAKSIY
jgi:lysophospholipase L1-like esterase